MENIIFYIDSWSALVLLVNVINPSNCVGLMIDRLILSVILITLRGFQTTESSLRFQFALVQCLANIFTTIIKKLGLMADRNSHLECHTDYFTWVSNCWILTSVSVCLCRCSKSNWNTLIIYMLIGFGWLQYERTKNGRKIRISYAVVLP